MNKKPEHDHDCNAAEHAVIGNAVAVVLTVIALVNIF